jgi:hypothetical protein
MVSEVYSGQVLGMGELFARFGEWEGLACLVQVTLVESNVLASIMYGSGK